MQQEVRTIERESCLKIINSITLMDNVFMSVFFENRIDCVEAVLNAVLPFKVSVKSVHTQVDYNNPYGRDVRFDIDAMGTDEKEYNIEVQRCSSGAVPKRARFHSGLLDSRALGKGQDFDEIVDTYVIFITEHNKPLYHIERKILETGKEFNDGSHILYINTAYKGKGESDLENLIHDFRCVNPEDIRNESLRKRFTEIKNNPTVKEVDTMNEMLKNYIDLEVDKMRDEILEEGREEGRAEGRAEGREEGRASNSRAIAKSLLVVGVLSVEQIAECCQLTVEEVNELKASA